jgi:hypothetical protein
MEWSLHSLSESSQNLALLTGFLCRSGYATFFSRKKACGDILPHVEEYNKNTLEEYQGSAKVIHNPLVLHIPRSFGVAVTS